MDSLKSYGPALDVSKITKSDEKLHSLYELIFLQEYLAAYPTTDLAYVVILDHTIAERERRYTILC